MNDCIFCRIVRQEIPADIVYEDERLLAFRDIKPQAPVHILIIPKQHIPSHLQLADYSLVAEVARVVNELAVKLQISQTGFRVVNNALNDGGQEVAHIHWHLLGGRKMTWPPG